MPKHDIPSVSRQCQILSISRLSLYYRLVGQNVETLELMRHIDKIVTDCPFYRSRQMVRALARKGKKIGRHRAFDG